MYLNIIYAALFKTLCVISDLPLTVICLPLTVIPAKAGIHIILSLCINHSTFDFLFLSTQVSIAASISSAASLSVSHIQYYQIARSKLIYERCICL